MTYPKLKPCPQCGKLDWLEIYTYVSIAFSPFPQTTESGWKFVECDNCYYRGPGEGRILHAIRGYNERAAKPLALSDPRGLI